MKKTLFAAAIIAFAGVVVATGAEQAPVDVGAALPGPPKLQSEGGRRPDDQALVNQYCVTATTIARRPATSRSPGSTSLNR
jgi:hypothetical protein